MPRYKRFLFYKKNNNAVATQYVANNLTIKYDINAYISNSLTFLYNILGLTAQSLWEAKEPDQAYWEPPDYTNPTNHPDTITMPVVEVVGDALATEDDDYIMSEDGDYLIV